MSTATSLTVYAPSSHLSSPFPSKTQSLATAALSRSLKTNVLPPSPPASPKSPSFSLASTTRSDVVVPDESQLSLDTSIADLKAEPRANFDVTAKLFLPSPSSSSSQGQGWRAGSEEEGKRACAELLEDIFSKLSTLLGEEAGRKPDTLVVSWGGVSYEGEETDYGFGLGGHSASFSSSRGREEKEDRSEGDGETGCGSLKLAEKKRKEIEDDKVFSEANGGVGQEALKRMVNDWQAISSSPALSSTKLGVAHFSQALLANFFDASSSIPVPSAHRHPTINHLTLKDCCHIPQDLSNYAREKGISLISSDDASVPISDEDLVHLLSPYSSTLSLPQSAPKLAWLLKYTILHRSRGVVVDRGYILSAIYP